MAVVIRLKRFGKKKKPVYRVVVAEKKNPRDGKTIEEIGFYDPLQEPIHLTLKEDRANYWLSVGAQPTKIARRLLAGVGVGKAQKVESANQKIAKKDRKKSSDSED